MNSDNDIFHESNPVRSQNQSSYDPFYLRPPDSMECIVHDLGIPHERRTSSSPRLSPQHHFASYKAPKIMRKKCQESFVGWEINRVDRDDEIYHSDDNQSIEEEKMVKVRTNDRENSSEILEGSSRSGKEVAVSGSETKSKPNDYATKNFLQFLMKVCKNYLFYFFKDEKIEEAKAAWEQLVQEKRITTSLKGFTTLFKCKALRRCLRRMFQCYHLRREIISSGVDNSLKEEYLKRQQVLRSAFKRRRLDYLH